VTTWPVTVTARAWDHAAADIAWHQTQAGPAVAATYLARLDAVLDELAVMPLLRPDDEALDARHVFRRGFPQAVWYRVRGGEVRVLAITHGRMSCRTVEHRVGAA